MGKVRRDICPYCGRNRKLTTDHVVPSCLFIQPFPPNMITVKACHECNTRKKSGDDSLLRDFLCMDMWGSTHPIARTLFEGEAMRSIISNRSELGAMAIAIGRLKPFYTPHGVYLGEAAQFEIPDSRIERIIATIVRGLYFYERKVRLPDDCQFHVSRHLFGWEFETIRDVMSGLHMHGPLIRGDVFGATYAIASEDPFLTMWILVFYNRVVFSVFTERHI